MTSKAKKEEEEIILEAEEDASEENSEGEGQSADKDGEEKEAGKENKDSPEGSSEEDDDEEDGAEAGEKLDPELEAKRERRRREKRMRKEKRNREFAFMTNEIVNLRQELKQLKEVTGKQSQKSQINEIESERKEIINVYNTAQKVMEAAITEGDGKKFAEAKAISDKAFSRYNMLEAQRAKYIEAEEASEKETSPQDSFPDIVGEEGKRYGMSWMKRNSSWYDPKGGNLDSRIALAIDTDLYNEGYDPNTKEYWDEFDDRCKDRLPHRYKNVVKKAGSKQIVGGGGRESNPAAYKSITVPKEFLQSLTAAGYEKGSDKYNTAVKHYLAQKKGA